MKKLALFSFAALATAGLFAEVTITGVTARQRWPWNNLVDVDFNVSGAAQGEAFAISVSATATIGGKDATFYASSYTTEPIAKDGANRVVWDFGADYPDTKVDDLLVTVTATPFSDTTPLYLVVDISGGATAPNWPVHYTTQAPVHTAGVEDPCKTTEIWLKRVKAGTIKMGNGNGSGDPWYRASYTCTLTNDYYLGIFPVTQAQCYNICGSYYSKFTNALYRATRPVDSIKNYTINYPYFDSANPATSIKSFQSTSVLGRLRVRTGLGFLLPTEWQWEYACRAGSASGARYPNCQYRYSGNSNPPSTYEWKNLRGMWSADYGTSYVDAYPPNAWGFYSMIGNVWEHCLNRWLTIAKDSEVLDPLGPSGWFYDYRKRVVRGGNWSIESGYCTMYNLTEFDPDNSADWCYGFRLCLPVWNVK